MKIAEVSVNRPVFAIMMTAALIVLGAASYESLGLDLMPKTDAAVVSVQANLPGASAEEIETQITKRIEEAVNTISGIDELRASSDQGNSRVTINFTLEREIESATQDVRDKLAQIVNQFPRDTRPLQITKMDPDAQPIFGFAVIGPRAPKELTEIAEKRVKQELETVQDVGSVGYNGERKREIQLLLDADRLNAYGLSVDQVRNAVERQNVEIPGGQFTNGAADVALRTMGRIRNVEDFNRIVISYRNDGSVITFRDIGRVVDHDAGSQRQRQHGHVVQREPGDLHEGEGADDRGRNRQRGDKGDAQVPDEQEHHHAREQSAEDQVQLDFFERSPDEP